MGVKEQIPGPSGGTYGADPKIVRSFNGTLGRVSGIAGQSARSPRQACSFRAGV